MSPLTIDAADQALTELKTLLEQRIAESDNGDVDTRSFAEIAEAVLRQDKSI